MLVNIYNDDTFIVSYPKSGTTWFRFILSNYISANKCDTFFTNSQIPDIHAHSEICNNLKRPRILKSHSQFDPEYNKVIYLVRDVRDVCISFYFHSLKYNRHYKDYLLSDFIVDFHDGKLFGGNWGKHVNGWLKGKTNDFLLIRYEDLLKNTEKEFCSALRFLNIPIDLSMVKLAIEASSFSNMRSIEAEESKYDETLLNSDKSLHFIRKGVVGDHRNYLNEKQLYEFSLRYGDTLHKMKY